VPHLVCLCPSTPPSAALLTELEIQLAQDLVNVPGISVLTSAEVLTPYPVTQVADPYSDELGHIPYTEAFFAALGTSLARRLEALQRPPYKVIVLDCDQTLWGGVVGEEGALGLVIDPPRQALQEFMRGQAQAGKLLCLCSKNNESEVLEVFARRPEMRLRRADLVAWRINWQPKSENLLALAAELGLGLDSFIFLDDNPLECAEVQAHCPEVLTLQLPAEPRAWAHFLAHVWAFDHLPQTAEDRQRTALYQQNAAREQ